MRNLSLRQRHHGLARNVLAGQGDGCKDNFTKSLKIVKNVAT